LVGKINPRGVGDEANQGAKNAKNAISDRWGIHKKYICRAEKKPNARTSLRRGDLYLTRRELQTSNDSTIEPLTGGGME